MLVEEFLKEKGAKREQEARHSRSEGEVNRRSGQRSTHLNWVVSA